MTVRETAVRQVLEEPNCKRENGNSRKQTPRGHTPQGGNSHDADCAQGPPRGQAAVAPKPAPLPTSRAATPLPDRRQPAQRPRGLPDGGGPEGPQHDRVPRSPALSRAG